MCAAPEEDFNTSHVSINLALLHYGLLHMIYFNTSHVSINRVLTAPLCRSPTISIHLMFLLIYTDEKGQQWVCKFQYISCFY